MQTFPVFRKRRGGGLEVPSIRKAQGGKRTEPEDPRNDHPYQTQGVGVRSSLFEEKLRKKAKRASGSSKWCGSKQIPGREQRSCTDENHLEMEREKKEKSLNRRQSIPNQKQNRGGGDNRVFTAILGKIAGKN